MISGSAWNTTHSYASFGSNGDARHLVLGNYYTGSDAYSYIQARYDVGDVTVHPLLLNPYGGNVGIGTTNPGKKLDVSGEIRASAGILFGTDTAAANTLNDYEEGTWTPIIGGSGGGTKTPGGGNQGWYVKVGRLVTVGGTLSWSGGNAIVGSVQIQGLPYTASIGRAWGSVGVTAGGITVSPGYTGLALVIDPGANYIYLIQTTTASYNHQPGVNASGVFYGFGATYRVN